MSKPLVGPLCLGCAYIRADYTCDAFPGGIPDEIFAGGLDHTEPFPGDHGLTFKPRPADQAPPKFKSLMLEELSPEEQQR